MHIGVDGEAGAGQQTLGGFDVGGIEANTLGQAQPTRNAAFAGGVAVMIEQARAPFATQCGGWQAGQQAGVFGRDLAPGELAAMQLAVKGMQIVVALGTDGVQRRFEFRRRQKIAHHCSRIPS